MFVCIINCSCDLYCRYEMCCITRVEYRAKRNIFKCKYCLWICPLMIIIWSMLNSSPSRYNIWDTAIWVFLFPFYVALFLASHSFNITTDLSPLNLSCTCCCWFCFIWTRFRFLWNRWTLNENLNFTKETMLKQITV